MLYIKVEWHHESALYPVLLYSELDDQRWECRKVEQFADGRSQFASADAHTGDTRLGEAPVPTGPEINAQEEFTYHEIDRGEFEALWQAATDQ